MIENEKTNYRACMSVTIGLYSVKNEEIPHIEIAINPLFIPPSTMERS